jgi:hypothetical protein
VAKPATLPDGSVNLMVWKCVVPGKEGVSHYSQLSVPTPKIFSGAAAVFGEMAISATRIVFPVLLSTHLKSTQRFV